MAKYNEKGQEIPDNTRIEVPLRYRQAPSMDQRIKAMFAAEKARMARDLEEESERDWDDFEVDVDPEDVRSMHELDPVVDDFLDAKTRLETEYARVKAERGEVGSLPPHTPEGGTRRRLARASVNSGPLDGHCAR